MKCRIETGRRFSFQAFTKSLSNIAFAISVAAIFSLPCVGQPGTLDPAFSNAGFGIGTNASVMATERQTDGKILVGGLFTTVNGVARNFIARLNANGSLDTGFDPGTGTNDWVYAIAVQSDGKILIGGIFTIYNGTSRGRIARLNTNGSLDATFNPGTGANDEVHSIAIQSDGKVLIGGFFTSVNGTSKSRVARLNTNGTLDGTFDPVLGPNGNVNSMAIQSDGKVLVGGTFTTFNGSVRGRFARLNTNGSLDTGFAPVGAGDIVEALVIQTDGKYILGGWFTTYNGTARNRVVRVNTDGTLDATFDPGTGANNFISAIAVQSDGKVVIGGNFPNFNGTLVNRFARLNSDGTLDGGFSIGTSSNGTIRSLRIQPDGKILAAGVQTSYSGIERAGIFRVNSGGSMDTDFNPTPGANGPIYVSIVQSDGKIIIGGNFTNAGGALRNRIARLNSDGSLDATFDPGSGVNLYVSGLALQSNGKILIVGGFTSYNGTGRNRLALLNADGTLDAAFNPGTGANSWINSVTYLASGKIIIAGDFTSYNGTARNYIAQLNANGSLDGSFDPGTGPGTTVTSVSVQSDGKLVITGYFATYNGVGRSRVARVNPDGSLDNSFNPGTGANSYINYGKIQPDGKILVGGSFTSYNSIGRNRIARINTDGSLDNSFNPGTGVDAEVWSIGIQPDDRIVIGGAFTDYNGTSRNRLVRINSSGTLDTNFDPGSGAGNVVRSVSLQVDGMIVVGGDFIDYAGAFGNRIVRVVTEPPPVAPTAIAATSVSSTGFTANWNSVAGAAAYGLDVSADNFATFVTGYNNKAIGATSEPVTGLTANTDYKYRVRAVNSGTSPNSNVISVTTATLPPVAIGATAIAATTFTANWNNMTGASSYRLDVSSDNFSSFVTGYNNKSVAGTSDGITSLTAGTAYKYRVRTMNASGGTSGNSNVIDVTTVTAAPVSIAATSIVATGFTANWNAVTGASDYRLDVSADNFSTFVTGYSNKTVSGTTDAVTGLTGSTAYKYRTRAVNAGGTSTNSNVIDVTTAVIQNQTITFNALPAKTLGDPAFNLTATSTSGLTVTFESVTLTKVSIAGTTATLTAPGSATIRAKQVGNGNYNPAPDVDRTFCINPAKPVITLTNPNTEAPTLTSSAAAGNQWFQGGNPIAGATNTTLTVAGEGVYTVQATVEGCVSVLSDGQAMIITGEVLAGPGPLSVYPNPAREKMFVSLTDFHDGIVHVSLVDLTGRVVWRQTVTGGKVTEMDISGNSKGFYLLTAQQGTKQKRIKFIID